VFFKVETSPDSMMEDYYDVEPTGWIELDCSLHFTCYRSAARVAGFGRHHVRSTEFVLAAGLVVYLQKRQVSGGSNISDNRKSRRPSAHPHQTCWNPIHRRR